jgi:hypothetical protein
MLNHLTMVLRGSDKNRTRASLTVPPDLTITLAAAVVDAEQLGHLFERRLSL